MFKFMVKFLKILTIACLIGVSLRIIEVVTYKKDGSQEKQVVAEVISNNTIIEDNKENSLSNEENKQEETKKITQEEKKYDNNQQKTTKNTTEKVQEIKTAQEKTEKVKTKQVENTKEDKQTTLPQETSNNYTEYEINIAPKKECENNNHLIDAGNSGRWFENQEETKAYYNKELSKWGNLWESGEIEKEEYLKKCPYGYEEWTCPQCHKWTINFYYRNN